MIQQYWRKEDIQLLININKFIDSLPEKFRGMNNLVPIVIDHLNKIENSLKKSSRVDPFER